MTPRRHALFAKTLIDRCGGLDEVLTIPGLRVKKPQLSNYQNPHVAAFMPADVIATLEAYCGEAIYSRALFDAVIFTPELGELVSDACAVAEDTAALQATIRRMTSGGHLTPRQSDELLKAHGHVMRGLQRVGLEIEAAAGAATSGADATGGAD